MTEEPQILKFKLNNPTDPTLYRSFAGALLPLPWRTEESGRVPAAVHAYYAGNMTDEQLQIVIAYLQYFIHAPCWTEVFDSEEGDLDELCRLSLEMKNKENIAAFITKCMDGGLDPL